MTSDLQGLLDRVMKAEGPDGELDYEIIRALHRPAPSEQRPLTTDREYYEPVTASIDAALALVRRVLPAGTDWLLETTPKGRRSFYICSDDERGFDGGTADMPTAPLAILAALLRAKIGETHPVPVPM